MKHEKKVSEAIEKTLQEGGDAGSVTRVLGHMVVTDVRMPFISMVVFMIKWSLAAIPALIILFLVGVAAWTLLIGVAGALSQ